MPAILISISQRNVDCQNQIKANGDKIAMVVADLGSFALLVSYSVSPRKAAVSSWPLFFKNAALYEGSMKGC
jgi:hypothetical protein